MAYQQEIQRLMDQRNRVLGEWRGVLEKAETEGRASTPEEVEQRGRLKDRAEEIRAQIEEYRSLEAAEAQQAEYGERSALVTDTDGLDEPTGTRGTTETPEVRSSYLRSYLSNQQQEDREATEFLARDDFHQLFQARMLPGQQSRGTAARESLRAALTPAQYRTMQSAIDTEGGYLLAPFRTLDGILMEIDNATIALQRANTQILPGAEQVGAVKLDEDLDDAEWAQELESGSEDDLKLGGRILAPNALKKKVVMSERLLMRAPNAEGMLLSRLGVKFAQTIEKAVFTGSGNGEPLGIFTPSNDGVPTSRDSSQGNTTDDFTFRGVIAAKSKMNSAYWARARWAFHPDALENMLTLKHDDNSPVYREAAKAGETDRMLSIGIDWTAWAPNTFTAGMYVGGLIVWDYYLFVLSLNLRIKKLVELYAEKGGIGFHGWMEGDGQPTLEGAFVRLKLADS